MKKFIPVLIICIFFVIGCANSNENLKTLSSSYDGIWEGYTETSEGRFDIRVEISDGMISGYCHKTKIKGYIDSDDNFFMSPFSIMGAQVMLYADSISPDRIEGTAIAPESRPRWFIKKTSDIE
jgi:hypothetical protein